MRPTARISFFISLPLLDPQLLLQEWLDRLLSAQELFNRHGNIARITLGINLVAETPADLRVQKAIRSLFENRSHISGDGVRPSVSVISSIVSHQVTERRNHRSGRIWR